eukprot:671152-Rhodomonas_salina.1
MSSQAQLWPVTNTAVWASPTPAAAAQATAVVSAGSQRPATPDAICQVRVRSEDDDEEEGDEDDDDEEEEA